MAIRKPETNYPLILAAIDDAVDVANSDIEKYNATLDESYLTFKDGEKPTRITLRPLTRRQTKRIAVAHPLKTSSAVLEKISKAAKANKTPEEYGVKAEEIENSDMITMDDIAYDTAEYCIVSVDGFASKEDFISFIGNDAMIALVI